MTGTDKIKEPFIKVSFTFEPSQISMTGAGQPHKVK